MKAKRNRKRGKVRTHAARQSEMQDVGLATYLAAKTKRLHKNPTMELHELGVLYWTLLDQYGIGGPLLFAEDGGRVTGLPMIDFFWRAFDDDIAIGLRPVAGTRDKSIYDAARESAAPSAHRIFLYPHPGVSLEDPSPPATEEVDSNA